MAEVRWYGATGNVLVDVRTEVELWGLESEIAGWHKLCKMDGNQNLTDNQVLEIMLEEYWPSKLQKLHLKKI